MARELKQGLSPDTFVSRVENSGSIIKEWPFGHLRDANYYASGYFATSSGIDSPDHRLALAIGKVGIRHGDAIAFGIKGRSGILELTMEEQEAIAWQQMIGVDVALQVMLGHYTNTYTHSREASITRILGIEQPIYPSRPNGKYKNKRASLPEGFIQGTVLEDTTPSYYYDVSLDFGDRENQGKLICNHTSMITQPDQPNREHPLAGDEMRARALRTNAKNTFLQTNTLIYIVNQNLDGIQQPQMLA